MKSTFFKINEQSFHALTAGRPENPPILFLHGFPEYSGAWARIIDNLKSNWYCVAPDQRGYGQSWRPEEVSKYEMKHLVSDTSAMIDLFGKGKPVILVAHDWGASVAYATAMQHPEKIENLIVLNGVHPAPFQTALANGGAQTEASQYINWLRNEGSEKTLAMNDFEMMFSIFSESMDMSWMTTDKMHDYKTAWRDVSGLKAMINWYRATPLVVPKSGTSMPTELLPKWDKEHLAIRMPHLLIWGVNDSALLPETKDGLDEYCQQLEVVEISGADHWIAHQKPTQVCNEIRRFLNKP